MLLLPSLLVVFATASHLFRKSSVRRNPVARASHHNAPKRDFNLILGDKSEDGKTIGLIYSNDLIERAGSIYFQYPNYLLQVKSDEVWMNHNLVHKGNPDECITATEEKVTVAKKDGSAMELSVPLVEGIVTNKPIDLDAPLKIGAPVELTIIIDIPKGISVHYSREQMLSLHMVRYRFPKYVISFYLDGSIDIDDKRWHKGTGKESVVAKDDFVMIFQEGMLIKHFGVYPSCGN